MRIWREYSFEAAHWLPHVPKGHKCGRMHGHSYRVRVTVRGAIQGDGMVLDFAKIDGIAKPIFESLDHRVLNEVIENPTSEELAAWLWPRLAMLLLDSIEVCETARSGCIYNGPGGA